MTMKALTGSDIETESDGRASFDKHLEELADLVAGGRDLDVSGYHHSRTALTGAKQTIALGAAYKNIRVWLDSGASPCHVALDGAADTDDPRLEDNMVLPYTLDADGASSLYIESTGSSGKINVEAWG